MAFEQNELQFTLFLNKKKEKANHPDRTGSVKVDGKVYRMAGWIKNTKAGDPYLSGALTLEEPKEPGPVPDKTTPGYADIDDDVPF